ncbi:MAG: tetratricopeptide repeat protein [Nodosilinea sp.]
MVKRKKNLAKYTSHGFGKGNLAAELRRAEAALNREDWPEARRLLIPLSQQYPGEKRVWHYLAEASFEIGDTQLFQKACEGLWAVDPTSSDAAYGLASAYIANMHPLMALQTYRTALALDPDHEAAPQARKTIKQLEPLMENILAEMGLTDADGLETATLHERGQAYLEQGDYAAAREAEAEVLRRHPEFMSAKNNLALISWMEGDEAAAIAITQAVLDREPQNIHALANLIHFLVVTGDEAVARPYGAQLKASQAAAWDGWTKKVEGLSYLADDAGVVEVFHQAQSAAVDDSPASALFYHWAAVALARMGDIKEAKAHWKKALQRDPSLKLAEDNLADLRHPVGQRHGAWPFDWHQWLPPTAAAELRRVVNLGLKSASDKFSASIKGFLTRHAAVLPRLMERGGPAGQEFVLGSAERLKPPALLALIKDFALGQNGTDEMRHRAAILAVQAKLLPKSNVTLWMKGEQRELMLLGFEFHDEPLVKHPKKVEQWLVQALTLLKQGDQASAREAEALINRALEIELDAPDLLNNLAISYLNQNREAEAYALIQDIATRFPDYVFSSASQAKLHLLADDIEAAEAILMPFLARDRFHFLEFNAFSDAYLELLMAKDQVEGARAWLQMWEQVDPDAARIGHWQNRLGRGKLKRLLGRK